VPLDDDARESGRSHPVTVGTVAAPGTARAELRAAVDARLTPAARESAAGRTRELGRTRAEQGARIRAAAEAEHDRTPISQAYLMRTLAAVAPGDAAIVDESATSLPHVLRHLPLATAFAIAWGLDRLIPWSVGFAKPLRLLRLLLIAPLFLGAYGLTVLPLVRGLGLRRVLQEFNVPLWLLGRRADVPRS